MFKANWSADGAAHSATRRSRLGRILSIPAVALFVAMLFAATPLTSPALAAATGNRPLAPGVIDYSTGFSSSTPATLKNAGVGVVIRYVGTAPWKCLSPGEAEALQREGIDVATVYESTAGWMLGGRDAGIAAARAARTAVIADGGPAQPFIYFACDIDTSDFANVNAALAGAQSVLGAENVGIYGSYSVCSSALKTNSAAKAWQTVAWSHGQLLPEATMLQLIPQTLGDLGLDYDANVRYQADIGQWGLARSPATSPTPAATEVVDFTAQSTPTSQTLRAIESTDGASAWAVGDGGTILHTTSEGATWTVQSTPTTATLRAVSFSDGRHGWAAGENGTVLGTTDGGRTWNRQFTSTTQTLKSIFFASNWSGWAVGDRGTVLHTGDGGVTWLAQSAPTTATLNSVTFSSETTGEAVGDGGTYVFTGNGGKSWFSASTPTTAALSARYALTPTSACSVGASGTVLRTTNDGATWAPQSAPSTSTLSGVEFADPSHGMAVGSSGTVLFTADSGRTWAPQSADTTAALNDVELLGKRGWIVGEGGKVYRLQVGTP
jgi:photosystem II stability/assembly factor-like uncharacterized protein